MYTCEPITPEELHSFGSVHKIVPAEELVAAAFELAAVMAAKYNGTLRRSKALDAVLMFSNEGPVFAARHGDGALNGNGRFRQWLLEWQQETGQRLEL